MRNYIYQYESWPHFSWNEDVLAQSLGEAHLTQGRVLGRLDSLGFTLRKQTAVAALSEEIVHSSEIEGARLSIDEVRSSVARMLGVETAGMVPVGHYVEGIVELMMDATRCYESPLTEDRLFGWHIALFPAGRSGLSRINTGAYRTETMQVVSGPIGRERTHYEAPPPEDVPVEMKRFLDWLNADQALDPVLKAGVAHLWFIMIHPFDDGNGRLARAITEMLLARSDNSQDRYYSVSTRMLTERKEYYAVLNRVQYQDADITEWLVWFIGCLNSALVDSQTALDTVLSKAEFWDRHATTELNARQQRMLNALLDNFEGKLTSSKWGKITKTSHDTALRDIRDLIEKGILERESSGGRNTSYRLTLCVP